MKKIILIISLLIINHTIIAQSTITNSQQSNLIDSIYTTFNRYITQTNRYEVYVLDNIPMMYLRLDTQTGKIDKVTIRTKKIESINNEDLSIKSQKSLFKLYPTDDTLLYILLDKATGRTWNILWNKDSPQQRIQQIQ